MGCLIVMVVVLRIVTFSVFFVDSGLDVLLAIFLGGEASGVDLLFFWGVPWRREVL